VQFVIILEFLLAFWFAIPFVFINRIYNISLCLFSFPWIMLQWRDTMK